jgi:hypothetical protein
VKKNKRKAGPPVARQQVLESTSKAKVPPPRNLTPALCDRLRRELLRACQDVAEIHGLTVEGGDLNDVIYTVKALGMVVSTDVAFDGGPAVMNGFSEQWQSVFGGGKGKFAVDGEDESYSGVHARSAIGGFTGRFSIEPEIIVAIPPELAKAIIQNRGWVFPLPPAMLDKVKADQG